MVTPVSISNYISLPDDFPVRNIAPQVKEVLKDFIDALSTIICNEEWRTSLNINSATKRYLITLTTYHIFRGLLFGVTTRYTMKRFSLNSLIPPRNGRHKENIEFQVVINLSPIYLDNFRHDGEINIFALPTQSLSLWGAYFRPASSVYSFCF